MKEFSEENAVIIFDTAAFLAGLHLLIGGKVVTVEEVIQEVKDSYSASRLEYGVEANKVELLEVGRITVSSIIPDELRSKLSRTDLKILQLAYEMKKKGKNVVVLTDDYALQKSLLFLKIDFRPVRHRGIKEKKID
ncbi:MAG: hypothetical protein QW039_06365 [Fervidicoccaceae archaeon]